MSAQGGGEHVSERTSRCVSERAQPTTPRWRRTSAARLVVVEALLDELLLHRSTVRVEAGELEVLLVLEVHVVLAAAVLLDRDDRPSRGSAAPGTG